MFERFSAVRGALCLCVASAVVAPALGQLRVLTWNVSNYGGSIVTPFQTALFAEYQGRSAKPDIFLGQEFLTPGSLTTFVNLMNAAPGSPGDYVAAPFVDGPDTDSVMIYRSSKVTFNGVVTVAVGGGAPNHPRNIMRYDVTLKGYTGSGAKLSMYSSHWKAGTLDTDKERRLLEAQRIRDNAETLGRPFLLGGDLNVQSSSETSYVESTGNQANNAGQLFDPIVTPGTWNNSVNFRFVHTQDPVPGQAGIDDRYDFILLSQALIDGGGFEYLGNPAATYSTTTWNDPNHSYRSWGNDGSTFNAAIKIAGNTMVGQTIAQALADHTGGGSGHLPVFLDLRVPGKAGVPSTIDMGVFVMGAPAQRPFTVSNAADVALWSVNGVSPLTYSLSATSGFTVPGGNFSAPAGAGNGHTVTVDTFTPGTKTGTITVTSNDPDQPVKTITVKARVLPFRANGGDIGW